MIMLSLLVFMNDKAKVEEVITLSRYVFMEGFTSYPLLPKPHKMIEKIPTIFRSRLQVWVTNRLLDSMLRITREGGFSIHPTKEEMTWPGIFNMFTGQRLEIPFQLTSLFYLGYLKNKNESAEVNSLADMYTKIVEMEDKRPSRNQFLGLSDPPVDNVETHEFSVSLIKLMCLNSKKLLQETHGQNYMQQLENSILDNLANSTVEDLSTLKASSSFDSSWYKYDPTRHYSRKRAIEAVRTKIKTQNSTMVMDLLKNALALVEEAGCMHICLFKKMQHGGLREIYVLAMAERIIQLFIENIARSLCKMFPFETMTNPKYKTYKNADHSRRAKEKFGSSYVTYSKAADAKKWNQGHFVTKFALTLIEFTPKYMHPLIVRGLSIFLKKRIMIDQDLMEVVIKNSQLKTSSYFLQKVSDVFRGRVTEPVSWYESGGNHYIDVETGMMKGILHYTSSAFHCLKMTFMKTFI